MVSRARTLNIRRLLAIWTRQTSWNHFSLDDFANGQCASERKNIFCLRVCIEMTEYGAKKWVLFFFNFGIHFVFAMAYGVLRWSVQFCNDTIRYNIYNTICGDATHTHTQRWMSILCRHPKNVGRSGRSTVRFSKLSRKFHLFKWNMSWTCTFSIILLGRDNERQSVGWLRACVCVCMWSSSVESEVRVCAREMKIYWQFVKCERAVTV